MKKKRLYRFGIFALDTDENVLRRDGERLPLTPKMFDLLLVLVQSHGKILDKDTLLKEVWPDSFVEEGNIAFNVRQLRKVLDDDAQSPTFIETIPRRGYRFIAKVEDAYTSLEKDTYGDTTTEQLPTAETPAVKKFRYQLVPVFVLLVCATAFSSWYFLTHGNEAPAPILYTPFAAEKLSTTGMTFSAGISPDGKTVVYTSRNAGKESVWLRQLDTGNNVEFIPASEARYFEFAFSPDGNQIYFSRGNKGSDTKIGIFRVSIRGGIPEQLVDGTQGWVSVSPDGQKLSFVRCPYQEDDYCSLYVADSKDGKNERKLLSRPRPIRIADNEISPDGTKIAFAAGQSRNQANEFRLLEVEIENGVEREITAETFFNIKSLIWLPDKSGLLLTASKVPNKHFRIWQVSVASGKAEPLTKDPETYSALSIDKAAEHLVSTQIKQDFHLYVFDFANSSEKRLLTDATNASFAPNGKIYFNSSMTGNDEIWSINADSSGQRQLTNDPSDEGAPIVSPDNKKVYFASNRSGKAHIWQMNTDGSGQEQLTITEGGFPLFVSADGKSVYFRRGIDSTLWKVSVENGEEAMVLNRGKGNFEFSPDGSLVAVEEKQAGNASILIVSTADGQNVRSFSLPNDKFRLIDIAWPRDGKSIIYIASDIDYEQNALYRQSLDGGPPQKIADLGDDEIAEVSGLSISPDGKKFILAQGGWKHDAVLIQGLK
ncbi:MAG: winged helix-turn-helix domain-containing protein [Pyrinomonadaceae bacterium]